jgi:putative DNA primase/helicase
MEAVNVGRKLTEVAQIFDRRPTRSVDHRLTDLGNAERLVELHGADLRYVAERGWFAWDGRRWRRDDTGEAERRAKETVRQMYAEAADIAQDGARKTAVAWALRSESRAAVKAMVDLARSEAAVVCRADDFDTDPDLLNFRNGTLNLSTGELTGHFREDRITRLVELDYRPEATCPRFLSFLADIMGGNAGLIAYLQTAFGYSLTGRTSEKAVFVCHGSGDNGKSTLLNAIREAIPEYSVTINVDSLMAARFQNNANALADLADLMGARFAMTSETEQDQRLSEGKLKRITQGMGTIRATRKYENPISFTETHKLWMDCNHRPKVKDDGRAVWNRLHLIPFTVTIPRERQDRNLSKALADEADGILAWVVQGARRWYRDGLTKPPEVEAATREWKAENDVLEAFLSDCCVRDKAASCPKSDL